MKKNFLFLLTLLLTALPMLRAEVLTLTVNDGTSSNSYVPVYGLYTDSKQISQFIIPAESLTGLGEGATISKMTFYLASSAAEAWTSTFDVSLLEVAGTTIGSAYESLSSATQVYSGVLNATASTMEVVFTQTYDYNGGNLLVDTRNQAAGNYKSASFYGVAATGASASSYSGSTTPTARNFLPKVTFEYEPAATGTCTAKPGKPEMSDVLQTSATATWTAAEGVSNYQYLVVAQGADLDWSAAQTVPATTVDLTGLTANTAYTFAVRSYCGAGEGEQSNPQKVNFRTACGSYDLAVAPYTCGFEAADGFSGSVDAPCFEHGKLSSSSYCNDWVLANSTYANNSSAALGLADYVEDDYDDYYYYSSKAWFAFPQVIVPNATDYEVTFFARGNGAVSGDSLAVYVNSVQSMTGATRLGCIDHTQLLDEYEQFSFILPAGAQYVILAGYTAGDDYYGGVILVDDVVMREIPNCRPAKDLHFVSSDFYSATFAWTPANGETEWQLQYKTTPTGAFSKVDLNEPTFTITGLTSGTAYAGSFILHSKCEDALSPDSAKYAIPFATACEQVEADTVRFNAEIAELTPCYENKLVKGTSSYRWSLSSTAHSGSKSFYLSGASSSTNAVLFSLPEFSLRENQQVNFYVKEGTHSTSDSLLVYLVLEGDTTLLTKLESTNLSASWTEYKADLSEYRGDHARLLFLGYNYNALYIDDVEIAPVPNCQKVSNIGFVGFEPMAGEDKFAATFNWNRGGEETMWTYAFSVKADTTNGAYTEWDLSDPSSLGEPTEDTLAVLDNLEPNMSYHVKVAVFSACDEGESFGEGVISEFAFKTPCVAISGAEYSENFETATTGSGKLPDCWNYVKKYSTGYPYAYNSSYSSHGGSNCLYWYNSYSESDHSIVALPLFEEDINDLRLKFYYKNYSSGSTYGKFIVGTMSNFADESTFVPYEELNYASSYALAQIDFANVPAGQKYIAIKLTKSSASYGGSHYIDDITVGLQPACVSVRNLKVADITTSSAKIQWETGKNETEWSVQIKRGSTVVFKDTIGVPYVEIDTLQTATSYTYTVLVKAMCDGVEAAEFLPEQTLKFMTECEAITSTSWSEGFESYSVGSYASENATCWSFLGNVHTSSTTYPLVYVNNSATYCHSGSKSLYFQSKANTPEYAILPPFDVDFDGVELTFWYRNESASASNGLIKFGYMTDPADATTFVALFTQVDYTTVFEKAVVDLSSVPADARLAFCYTGGTTNNYYFAIDDIALRVKPVCEGASDIHAVDSLSTPTTATIAWSGNSDAGYDVILMTAKDTVLHQATDTFLVIDDLQASKDYVYNKVLVVSQCEAGAAIDTAVAKNVHVATACVALTIPFSTDFEGLPNGSSNGLPACWNKIQPASSNYSYISTSEHTSGTQSLYMYGGGSTSNLYAILPAFADEVELSGARIAFNYRSTQSYTSYGTTYNYGNLVVGVMSDPEDAATFVALDTLDQKSSFAAYELYLTNAPTGYHYVALCYKPTGSASSYSNYGAAYIDDVRVTEIPTCFPGTNLHALAEATTTSVKFGWTPNVEDNQNAHVVVKNGEAVIADAIVNDSVYEVTGLQSGTRYTFAIQVNTVCGDVESTDALIGSLTMETECEAKALPWSHSFEDAESSALPVCWTKTLASGSNPYVSTSSDALYFYGGGATSDQIVALPQVNQPLNELTLTISYKNSSINSSSTTYGTFKVGYYTDLTGEFVEVAELPQVASTTEEEVFLSAVPAEAQYLAIRYNGGESNYGTAYVYELSLTETPSCLPIKSIAFSNVERRSLDITWTPKVPTDQYDLVISDVVLSDEALAAASVVAVTEGATTYHATGLMRDTKYYVYVRANCGAEDGQSAWVADSVKTKSLHACDDATIGTGSISATLINTSWGNTYSQHIYTAAELLAQGVTAGEISAVAFYYTASSTHSKEQSVYIATTTDNSFAGYTASDFVDAQKVYGPTVRTCAGGWMSYEFSTPFVWDGESNIVVGVLTNIAGSTGSGTSSGWDAAGTTQTEYRTIYRYQDNTPIYVNNLASVNNGSRVTARPNIKFTQCYNVAACPTVETVSHELLGDGTSSARISWTASTGDFANSYSVLYSETPITDWSAVDAQIDSIQVLDTVISGLNAYTDYYVYVAAHCDAEGQNDGSSEWSEAHMFKTAANCPVIVDLDFNATGRNTALATWKADYEDKNFIYVLSTEELDEAGLAAATTVAVTDTFVVFESLNYEQKYYLYVAHACGEDAHSPYLVDSIQTSASCPAVVNLHATETQAYTVRVAWESAEFAEETEWEVGVVGRESVAQRVAAKQALVIGLEAETDYTVYVKAICSEEESSALATLAVHTAAVPANDAQLGTGSSDANLVYSSYGNTYSQQIYTAAELNAMGIFGGKITSVAFNYTGTSSSYQKEQSIYIGSTAKNQFAGSNASDFESGLELVYGPEVRSYASGWQTYVLSTPFEWDGQSNIVVGVLTNQPGTSQSTSSGWKTAGTVISGVYRAVYKYRDSNAIDPADLAAVSSSTSGRSTTRPNIKFGFEPQACPMAKGLAASDITTTSATLSWVPGAAETNWEVVVSATALTNAELAVAEKDVLNYQLSKQCVGLTPDVDYHFYVRSLCSAEENGDWAHGTFMTLPTCNIPTAMHFENAGQDTAVIAWSGEAAQFEVAYSNGEISDTVVVSDTCCVIRGLNHSTIYTFTASVRAICGVADSSRWSAPATMKFATECAPIAALPWSENFDATPDMHCWHLDNGAEATTSSSYAQSSTGILRFNKQNATVLAVLPEFAGSLSALEFDYNWRCESTSNTTMGYLEAGYVTDPEDASTFVQLANHSEHKYTYQAEKLFFPNDVPAGARIAFRYSGQTGGYWLFVDDIEVKPAPTCFKPTALTKGAVTENSATFSWTPNGDESQWLVKLYDSENVRQDSIVVDAPNYTIASLMANTAYTYTLSVQAYCSEEDQSEAVAQTFSFRTTMPADATEVMDKTTNREFNADFSSADEQAKWCVVEGSGLNQFVFGTAADALLSEATAALYISDDESNYHYTVNSTSGAMIFRQIELPAVDSLLVEFDWLANGEIATYSNTRYDFGRAVMAPATVELSISSNTLKLDGTTLGYSACPAGTFELVGTTERAMANKTAAQHVATKLENVDAGMYKIIFGWQNDSSSGAQYPLSICNLSVKILDEEPYIPTNFEQFGTDGEKAVKVLHNGQVYIIRGGKIFSIMGHAVDSME